jgi:hypothetical protein
VVDIANRRESFIAEVAQQQAAFAKKEKPFTAKNITPYQAEKLKALFEKYFDVDKDGVLTEKDIECLNEKFVDFTGWNREETKMQRLLEYHIDLYKCLLMEINKDVLIEEHKKTDISLVDWMKMWDRLMKGSLALSHLPQWVQVMPFNLFCYLDKNGENHISKQNILDFYTDFMLMDDKRSKIVADNAWSQMTGNGDFKLTLGVYTMIFSNFLFGKTFYGPGLYMLGTFRECVENLPFKIIHPTAEEDKENEKKHH